MRNTSESVHGIYRKEVALSDGGLVRLLRRSADTITVLVHYSGATTEIYSFFREKDGRNRFTLLQNRTGAGALLPKSSLMVGDCDEIAFEK